MKTTSADVGRATRGPADLTQRELQVLRLLVEGLSNTEISRLLHISPRTAQNHVAAIIEKLHVDNRTQAAFRAVAIGLVKIG
jgi:DNA-binding NarL/FixJ family response regulator